MDQTRGGSHHLTGDRALPWHREIASSLLAMTPIGCKRHCERGVPNAAISRSHDLRKAVRRRIPIRVIGGDQRPSASEPHPGASEISLDAARECLYDTYIMQQRAENMEPPIMPGPTQMHVRLSSGASPPPGCRGPGTNPIMSNKANLYAGTPAIANWGFEPADARNVGARNVKRTQFAPGQEAPPRHQGHGDECKSLEQRWLALMRCVLCNSVGKDRPFASAEAGPRRRVTNQANLCGREARDGGLGAPSSKCVACGSAKRQTNPICPRPGGTTEARRPLVAEQGRRCRNRMWLLL